MTWSRLYDGSSLPSADSAWVGNTTMTQWAVSGGVLLQDTNAQTQYWRNSGAAASDMVFDMMVRVNSTAGSNDANKMWAGWILLDSGASDAWGFHLYVDRIKFSANGPPTSDAYVADFTGWNRVTIRKVGTTHELWVNNVLRYTKTGANANQGAGIWWGQGSSGGGSTIADIDYAWWRYASGDKIAPWAGDSTPDGQSGLVLG
jgi:hypothetical protein